jgi:hypothetical protein
MQSALPTTYANPSKANGYKFGDLLANIAASPAFRQK